MKIKIEQDYYDTGKKLYPFRLLNLNPGITVLIGCNGSGKSTLLHQIDIYCKRNNITRISYDNFRHGGHNATDELLLRGDMSSLILDVTSSEGERIYYNTARIAPKIKYSLEEVKAGEPFFLLIDGLDSGMDVVSIEITKINFLKAVKEECEKKGVTPYIIVSANSYETAKGGQCLSLLTGKYVQIKTYDKYKSIIKKTFDKKLERYRNE